MNSLPLLPLLAFAGLASAQYLTPNTVDATGGTLNGVTFTNLGLVGAGKLSGELFDSFGETMGAASGLSISGWSYDGSGTFSGVFNVLPDRGYGDGAYNYAARLHALDFTFTPYTGSTPVAQDQISLTYGSTTKFTYQDAGVTKYTTGLNPTGVGSLFGQSVGTVTAANGPGGAQTSLLGLDAEAVHLFADGSGYVSDEYGTYIARFDASKQITGITQLPAAAQPHTGGSLNFNGAVTPTDGRRNNQGLEGMSVSPDGTRLFALLQSATVQDTNGSQQQTRNNARLFVYDISTPAAKESPVLLSEHVVQLPTYDLNGNGSGLDTTAAQSEIVAISNTQFLMLTRDGNGLGKKTTDPIVFKSVQLVDFSGATNIVGAYDAQGAKIATGGVLDPAITPASALEVINLISPDDLARFGFNVNTAAPNAATIQEKWESMALVPDLSTADPNDYFLFVANDNDFQSSNVAMLQADGTMTAPGTIDARDRLLTNDATFLAYRVSIVPEPSALLLSLSAGVGLLARRRRRP